MDAPTSLPDTGLPLDVVDHGGAGRVRRRPPRRRTGAWVVLLLAAVAATVGWAFERQDAAPVTPAPVVEAPFVVRALGRLEPAGEMVAVAAPSGAGTSRVERVLVREGDRVEPGDVLAVLDSEPRLRAALAVAESTVEQARAQLARTEVVVASARAELEATLASSRAQLDLAVLRLARQRTLLATQDVTQDSVDAAQLDVHVARAAVDEVRARLDQYAPLVDGEPVDVALARRDLELAEAQAEQARADVDLAYIVAPRAGVVLDVDVFAGGAVGGETLLDLGETRRMTARVEVYETDVRDVRVGQAVVLTSRALPRELRGEVATIAPLVSRQSVIDEIPAASTDARVVDVVVALDEESSQVAGAFVSLQVDAEFQP